MFYLNTKTLLCYPLFGNSLIYFKYKIAFKYENIEVSNFQNENIIYVCGKFF